MGLKSRFAAKIFVFAVFLGCALSCIPSGKDAHLKLAQDFMDAYYVFANQQQALSLATAQAQEKISSEIRLLKGVVERQEDYRSRDVLFDLKQEKRDEREVNYFFELTIIVPQIGEQKRNVHLSIDRRLNKVKYFGEF